MKEATNQVIIGEPVIRLTPVKIGDDLPGQITLPAFEMIAYSQDFTHTRLT